MKEGTLQKAYELFWGRTQSILTASGVVARASFTVEAVVDDVGKKPKKNATDQPEKIKITTVCYLGNCKYKPTSPKKIDILLRGKEIYDAAANEIIKSTVSVSYMEKKGEEVVTLLPLHYDFDPTVKGAHPIFHAQLGSTKFTKEELGSVQFRSPIKAIEEEPLGTVRIPTACLNFASVLVGVAADHFDAPIFKQVIGILRKSELSSWNAQCAYLQSSISNGGFLPSHHWYEI